MYRGRIPLVFRDQGGNRLVLISVSPDAKSQQRFVLPVNYDPRFSLCMETFHHGPACHAAN